MTDKNYYVNENAIIDENVFIGKKTKIWHFSHIQSGSNIGEECSIGQNVNIGNNVKIQNNVSVYEGVEIQDNVFCGPSIVFTNIKKPRSEYPQNTSDKYSKTLIKKSASIGANSTIICGIIIGKYSLIGAGSVVTRDVPDFGLITGNPGKLTGWVNEKGDKIKFHKNGKSQCKRFFFNGENVKLMEKI